MDRIIVEYLANALWQIPLLAAGVAALLWALGSDVQTRHRVWLGVLAVAVLMPLRGMEMGHKITVFTPPPAELSVHSSASGTAMPALDPTIIEDETVVVYDTPAAKSGLTIGPATTRWLVRLYIGALLFAGWRILRAWMAAQGLLRRSRSIHLAPRAMAIFAQAAENQRIRLPRLRQSDETVSPVVIGAWHPVLLLPAGFDHLKDDEILAALSHEFAHLARRDYLINLICQIAALPISWHPATYLVQKRIRDTREMLCDAVAADEMASPVRYATCLVAFAFRALDNRQGALATQGMTMFDNGSLEDRILQLTQEPERPEPRIRLARLAGASLGLVLSVTLALLVHITPTLADAADPVDTTAPVPLTPPVELPAIPAPPAAPEAPEAPKAPSVTVHHHATPGSDEIQRGIAEEKRQQADLQRQQADRQRQAADRQREEFNHQREAADGQRQIADRQREEADRQRQMADEQREAAREKAEADREAAQEQREAEREAAQARREAAREIADAQREAAREAAQAAREAGEEARRHADDIKRQVAEAIKANEAARTIDMEAIRKQVSEATANVNTPQFKAQMAELQAHMKELHEHMAELRDHMKEINKEMEKSLNSPM
ncbi:MAG TPA: M56 family metallopeptidase [Magnetospirillaceae bacterium]|nr:M56 family metallopeptidase [Magnetospirillaceae bacterium]